MNRLVFIGMAFFLVSPPSYAQVLNEKVAANCAADYFKFCGGVALDDNNLNKCLKDNGSKISKPCLDSLIETGAIPAEPVTVKEADVTPEPEKKPDVVESVSQKIRDKIKVGVAGIDKGLTDLGNSVAKAAEPITKNFKPDPKVAIAYEKKKAAKKKSAKASGKKKDKKKKKNNFKDQDSGKWKGYPLRLEWRDDLRDVGGEITPYGYRDRLRH